jgi:hypothetical protein
VASGAFGSDAFGSDAFASHVFRVAGVVVVVAGDGQAPARRPGGGGARFFYPDQRKIKHAKGLSDDDEIVRILVAAGILD